MIVEIAIAFAAEKIVGELVKQTWKDKILAYIFPKNTYKVRLVHIINETIKEYETNNPFDNKSGKNPFYHSQVLFEQLSLFVLFKKGTQEGINKELKKYPKIIIPTQKEVNQFYQLFIHKAKADEKLKDLFVGENYKMQIFDNANALKSILSISIDTNTTVHDTNAVVHQVLDKLESPTSKPIPKELTTTFPSTTITDIDGRRADLKDIEERLNTNQKQVLLMNGMGGIGKTTLAEVYLTQNYEKYQHIAWVTSVSHNFETDLINTQGLMQNLQVPHADTPSNTYAHILQKLKSLPGKNLLIIDNATDKLAQYYEKLPKKPNWHLLVTSRHTILRFDVKELGFLNEVDSVKLFKRYYKRTNIGEEDIKKLVKNLEYHTLSIEILAITAQELRKGPTELNTAIRNNMKTAVTVKHSPTQIERIQGYLLATFDMSELGEKDITILKYLACLPPDYINYAMLKQALGFCEDILAATLTNLNKKGWLLHNNNKDTYKLHQIIRDIVDIKHTFDDEFIEPLILSVKDLLNLDELKDNPTDKFIWIPYGEILSNKFEDRELKSVAILQNNLATILQDLGEYAGAKTYMEKAISINEKNYKADHPTFAGSYSNMAIIIQDLGDYKEAKTYMKKAISIDEKNYKADHPSLAITYSNMAIIIQDLGDYKGAKTYMQKAIKIKKKNYESDHPSLAGSYSNMGLILKDQGNYKEAKTYMEKAISINEKNYQSDHPTLATSYSNMAMILKDLGEYAGAKTYMQKAIGIDEKNYASDHPTLAIRYSNMAIIIQDLGDYKGAKTYMQKAISIDEKNYQSDHPTLAISYSNMATILYSLTEYGNAKTYIEKAYTIFKNKLGEEHPDTIRVKGNLGFIIQKSKDK